MGVADDMTRPGDRTALLQALLDAADKWLDIRRVELTVFHDNAEAIRLYERYGFAARRADARIRFPRGKLR